MLKKGCKDHQNRTINRDTTPVQSMSPSNEQRTGLGARQNYKKETYKHHVSAPTAGTRSTIFPKLYTVIELIVSIKKGAIRFSIQRSFSYRMHGKKIGLMDRLKF